MTVLEEAEEEEEEREEVTDVMQLTVLIDREALEEAGRGKGMTSGPDPGHETEIILTRVAVLS